MVTHCEGCGLDYYYAPELHKCPDAWADECERSGAAPMAPLPATTWADECVSKVMDS